MDTKKMDKTKLSDSLVESETGFLTIRDYNPPGSLKEKEIFEIIEDLLTPITEVHGRR